MRRAFLHFHDYRTRESSSRGGKGNERSGRRKRACSFIWIRRVSGCSGRMHAARVRACVPARGIMAHTKHRINITAARSLATYRAPLCSKSQCFQVPLHAVWLTVDSKLVTRGRGHTRAVRRILTTIPKSSSDTTIGQWIVCVQISSDDDMADERRLAFSIDRIRGLCVRLAGRHRLDGIILLCATRTYVPSNESNSATRLSRNIKRVRVRQ